MSDALTIPSLLAANERFYRTFESLDYPALAALWEDSGRVFCVHPGWPPLIGTNPVLDSWKRIIANTAEIHFHLRDCTAHILGCIGFVTVFEEILSAADFERNASGAISTNLFAFDDGARLWRIFHHHASQSELPPDEDGSTLLV